MMMRACAHCGEPFPLDDAHRKYCSENCIGAVRRQQRWAQYAARNGRKDFTPPVRFPNCVVCDTALRDGQRKFCSNRCRRADFKRRHCDETPLDAEGEILVRDLEDCPRRLRLARLVDRFEGGRVFHQGLVHPTWLSPPRASR